jgi:adhesin HecA-like repeat protein
VASKKSCRPSVALIGVWNARPSSLGLRTILLAPLFLALSLAGGRAANDQGGVLSSGSDMTLAASKWKVVEKNLEISIIEFG